jgi:CheY-like chemotaxis protein
MNPMGKQGQVAATEVVPVEEDPLSILYIEDDPQLAEMYKLKLQIDGYQVTISKPDGVVLDRARRSFPDLIFLDIRAPHRDRIHFLETLRVNPLTSAIPVVILSDYSEHELTTEGAGLGHQDYLVKSSSPLSLSPDIDDWTRRYA